MKKFDWWMILIVVLGFLLGSADARAEGILDDVKFRTLNFSYHSDRSRDRNERHRGAGFQYKEVGLINFDNSLGNNSNLGFWKVPGTYYLLGGASGYEGRMPLKPLIALEFIAFKHVSIIVAPIKTDEILIAMGLVF